MKKDKMVEKLTESQMCDLAKLYKEYDCLWDVSSQLYKYKDARDTAYKQIFEKLNVSGLKVRDIPQKIKNLRTSYYTEIRKIDASRKNGGKVYKPRVSWFTIADEILGGISRTQYERTESEPTSNIMKINEVGTQNTITNIDKIAKKKNKTICHVAAKNITPQSISIQKNTSQSKNEDDEYDSFGKYIASSLRSLPREMSIIAKMELQKTMADIQLRSIRQRERFIQPVQCGPSTSSACDLQEDPLENLTVALEPDFSMSIVKTE